jgi:hypothetical protein
MLFKKVFYVTIHVESMPRVEKKMSEEYIKYVERRQRRWVKPDPDAKFAENCIQQLDALNIASSAGFYDEVGRAWTLSKRRFGKGSIEIFVKCVEKNSVKFAWIYPATQMLAESDDSDSEEEKGVIPVSIGDWVVQVAF